MQSRVLSWPVEVLKFTALINDPASNFNDYSGMSPAAAIGKDEMENWPNTNHHL
jgi:hypothetical protein